METNIFNIDEVLRNNAKIDPNLVSNHEKLEKELNSIGVKTTSRYSLHPPLKECDLSSFTLKSSFHQTHFK